MKKFLATILAVLFCLSLAGCAKKEPAPPVITEVFAFEDLIVNEGKNKIHIANFNNEIHTEALDALCQRLEQEVYTRYKNFDLKSQDAYLEIQSTIFEVEGYAQFTVTLREYPLSMSDGEMFSYVYDIAADKELTANDALAALGLNEQTLFDKTKAFMEGDSRGRLLSEVHPAGCRVLADGQMLVYYYAYSGTADSASTQKEFFSLYKNADGTYAVYDGCYIEV